MNNMPATAKAGNATNAVSPVERDVPVETLVQSTQSWDGVPYTGYGAGQPELTVVKLDIPPHTCLPWHRHVVPNAGYVVSGHLTVEDRDSGQKQCYVAGQAFNEQVGAVHRGITGTEPAVLVVTYAGYPGVLLALPSDGEN